MSDGKGSDRDDDRDEEALEAHFAETPGAAFRILIDEAVKSGYPPDKLMRDCYLALVFVAGLMVYGARAKGQEAFVDEMLKDFTEDFPKRVKDKADEVNRAFERLEAQAGKPLSELVKEKPKAQVEPQPQQAQASGSFMEPDRSNDPRFQDFKDTIGPCRGSA